ncbi:hypothetical protein BJ986_002113 [Phycicoccus badiiscoriae]|uniref:Uncharacterized protein n=1 Tax=Pedococcus badiiscoriae TaxID=642776 RepID=A0A852WQN5_9MICO|nr:hypothetical protein [Pedococcus badiiscoriae]NYG07626.1 hypothetical protein [Pedococcus badiiscoriae]
MERPRLRWAMFAALAVVFSLGTAWATSLAAHRHESAYAGLATYLFIPVPRFGRLTWRTRALLRRRP